MNFPNSEKIKVNELIFKRKDLLLQRQQVNKELKHIEYALRNFWSNDHYKALVKTERMKNLKQFKK